MLITDSLFADINLLIFCSIKECQVTKKNLEIGKRNIVIAFAVDLLFKAKIVKNATFRQQ